MHVEFSPSAIICHVLHDLHPVVHELVVEDPMGHAHREEHRHEVEALPEGELFVVPIVFSPSTIIDEILGDLRGSRLHFSLFSTHAGGGGSMGAPKSGPIMLSLVHVAGGPS